MYSQIVMVARVRWLTTVARTIFRPSVSGKMVILGKSKTGIVAFISTGAKVGGAKSGAV
jgi:hypothetical protein